MTGTKLTLTIGAAALLLAACSSSSTSGKTPTDTTAAYGGRTAVGGRGQQRTSSRRPADRDMEWALRRLLPGHVRPPLAPVGVEAERPHPHLQSRQQPPHPRQCGRRVHPVRHCRLVRDHLLGHRLGQLHVRQLQGRRCPGWQLARLEGLVDRKASLAGACPGWRAGLGAQLHSMSVSGLISSAVT